MKRLGSFEWIALLPFLSIRMTYLNFIPVFDGGLYAKTLSEIIANPTLSAFHDVWGHISLGYFPVYVLVGKILGASAIVLNGVEIAFGAVLLLVFQEMLRAWFQNQLDSVDRIGITALLGLHPYFLASSLNFNLDGGLLFYFVLALLCLIQERWKWACVIGFLLCFTKETGFLLWSAASLWCVRIKKAWLWLAFPPMVFALYYGILQKVHQGSPLWGPTGFSLSDNLYALLPLNVGDPGFRSYGMMMFVLNWNWIVTLLTLVSLGMGWWKRNDAAFWIVYKKIIFVEVAVVYAVTRVTPWTNPRYILAWLPLCLVLAFVPVAMVVRRVLVRGAMYGGFGILFFIACFHSADPVSQELYGTWNFGNHKMYRATAFNRECCGPHGLDQWVYNLQFTHVHDLTNQFLRRALRDPTLDLVVPTHLQHGLFFGWSDPKNHERTLHIFQSTSIPFRTTPFDANGKSQARILYLEVPFLDSSTDLQILRDQFKVEIISQLDSNGYRFTVHQFDR